MILVAWIHLTHDSCKVNGASAAVRQTEQVMNIPVGASRTTRAVKARGGAPEALNTLFGDLKTALIATVASEPDEQQRQI